MTAGEERSAAISRAETVRREFGYGPRADAARAAFDSLLAGRDALDREVEALMLEREALIDAAEGVLTDAALMAEGTLYHCSTEPMYVLFNAVQGAGGTVEPDNEGSTDG